VANLCVPYNPEGFAAENTVRLVDRTLYPEAQYPAGQWDYQYFYRERFDAARRGFEGDVRATVKALFRSGKPKFRGSVSHAASVRARDGWFGPDGAPARDRPRDEAVLTQEDEDAYTEALSRNGFFGPGSWYMNAAANIAFAQRAREHWRLDMPVLFLHALYDDICATDGTRLPEPMRAHCPNLTEHRVASGHWMAQERPNEVNAFLARWLAEQLPQIWPKDASAP
jgi:pimeloyl-ACP methyl ester carboxylesterase